MKSMGLKMLEYFNIVKALQDNWLREMSTFFFVINIIFKNKI